MGLAQQLCNSVNIPPQNDLMCIPVGVPLPQFLSRNGVFTVGVRACVNIEYLVEHVKKVMQNMVLPLRASLDNKNKFVRVDVDLGCCGGLLLGSETPPAGIFLRICCDRIGVHAGNIC